MFFHSKVFIYSLLFLILSKYSISQSGSEILLGLFENHFISGILLIIFIGFIFFQIGKSISGKISMTPIPIFFVLSSFGLLYFTNSQKQQNILIVLCFLAYYFMNIAFYRLKLYAKDKTAIGIIGAAMITTAFLFYSAIYGFYLNFAVSLWILMIIFALITFFITFQYLNIINKNKKEVFKYSLILAFIMLEIVWVINFWPFGYLTTGVIALIFYYVLWDIVVGHFLKELSKKRILVNIIFFGIMIVLILATSRWLPLI